MGLSSGKKDTFPTGEGKGRMSALIRSPKGSTSVLAALRLGVYAMRQRPKLALFFLLLTFVQGSLQGVLIWALREVLLEYSQTQAVSGVLAIGSALIVFGIWSVRAATVYGATVTSERLARLIEIENMWVALAKLLRLPMSFFARHSGGNLVLSSYADLQGVRLATLEVGRIVLHLTTLVSLVVAASLMSPRLALIGIVIVPLGTIPVYWIGKRIREAADKARNAMTSLYNCFLEINAGIEVIKVNRAEAYIDKQAQEIGQELYTQILAKVKAKALARLMLESVSGLGLVGILILGGREVAAGTLGWESLLGLLIAVMAVYAPLNALVQSYGSLRSVLPNLERVEQIMAEPEAMYVQDDPTPLAEAPAVIELRNVSFSYGGDPPVLSNLSATFRRGETIGIVGHSGAGKSTLFALLLRFYDPTGGEILFDGVSLRQIRYEDLLRRCAIVPQEPFLFFDTIAENIRIGRPEGASMDEVRSAARAASIHDEILELAEGYETKIGRGKDGRGLSVGQKQRVTIAAALLKNAPMLFLDEATSSLDSISERKVQAAIDTLMQGRTTFIIAHRLSTLRNVDRILVLNQGRLAGLGSHDDLLLNNPVYQQLWQHQVGEMPEVA